MSDEKTEEPTQKKLREARKDGHTTKSQDLAEAASLFSMVITLSSGAVFLANSIVELIHIALDFVSGDHSEQGMTAALYKELWGGLKIMGPISLISALAAAMAMAAQVGIQISLKPVMPKFDSINPASGLKKIFSAKSAIDLLKMIIKALILLCVLWKTIVLLLPLVTDSMYEPLAGLIQLLWSVILRILGVTFVVYLVLGAADWFIQHWMFIKTQRMSKDEVKREHKSQNGDPHVKGERRRLARELRKSDPRAVMPKANVVIVNPTHYAVAIRYVPSEHPLPRVIAKGIDEHAALLRLLAHQENIPIVANPPVARALYKVGLDVEIPEDLFEVVAAILRWVDGISAMQPAPLE